MRIIGGAWALAIGASALVLPAACSSPDPGEEAGGAAAPQGGAKTEAGPGPDVGPSACDVLARGSDGDLELREESLQGYPPYAAGGCTLVYVRRSSGALVARELGTGVEREVAPAVESPRRPVITGRLIAWEATLGGLPVIRAEHDGRVETLAASFHHAREPRVAEGLVTFTAWANADEGGDTNVLLFRTATGAYETIAAGPGQQRFSDVSETHVALSDFSEDPDGRFDDDGRDLADLAIYDLRTRTLTRRANPGKDAFPVLASDDLFGYLHWGDIHPEPKLEAFVLRAARLGEAPSFDRVIAEVTSAGPVVRPSANRGMLAWVVNVDGASQLWRAPADGSTPATRVAGLEGLTLYAPAVSDRFTLVAARAAGGAPPTLRLLPR